MEVNISIEDIIADVARVLDCPTTELGATSRFGCAPGWDSLSQLKIILVLEEKYGLNINDFEHEQLFSIEGIFDAVLS